MEGIEPSTSVLSGRRSTTELHAQRILNIIGSVQNKNQDYFFISFQSFLIQSQIKTKIPIPKRIWNNHQKINKRPPKNSHEPPQLPKKLFIIWPIELQLYIILKTLIVTL